MYVSSKERRIAILLIVDASQKQPRPQIRGDAPVTKIYLESRYRKFRRGLPQTIFWCPVCKGDRRRRKGCEKCQGYGKLTKDSVQELISRQLLPAYRAKKGKFHGAGREDIDVLMLGRGRPFVFEVVGPRVLDVDLTALREAIHERSDDAIEIDPFEPVRRERIPYWKESLFEKVYLAQVEVAKAPADEFKEGLIGIELNIAQRTPSRVAHRRADLTRERKVVVQKATKLDETSFELELRCSHGTYVKEWVSGEDGRTEPSLPDLLGAECRCRQLDVLDILTGP